MELFDSYRRDGFGIARHFLSEQEVAEIRDTFMAAAANGPVAGFSEVGHHNVPFGDNDPLAQYPRMMHPHLRPDLAVGPPAMKYMLHPRLEPLLREMFRDEPYA